MRSRMCVDAVVAGGVELVHVVARAPLDREARLAGAARLAVDRRGAVEHLGEDARRGRLARAAGPGEEVRLALAAAGHGVAQRPHDVVLAPQLAEPARPVAAVERGGGHRTEPIQGVSRRPEGGSVVHVQDFRPPLPWSGGAHPNRCSRPPLRRRRPRGHRRRAARRRRTGGRAGVARRQRADRRRRAEPAARRSSCSRSTRRSASPTPSPWRARATRSPASAGPSAARTTSRCAWPSPS